MEEIDLTAVRTFRAIVESGSFTAAADRMGMSAPMVSKHVARLERRLGARLLHRTSRRLSLTEAGSLFFEQGRRALDLLDDAAALIDSASTFPRGELKISAPVWCATPVFAKLLADYRQTFPDVQLDLHLDNRTVDLAADGFDLALRVTAEPSEKLIARRLCTIPFHLVATPSYMNDRPADTLHLIVPNYVPLDLLRIADVSSGIANHPFIVMKSNSSTLIRQAVLAGIGAAVLPSWIVEPDVETGRLLVINADTFHFQRNLFAVYSSRSYLPPKLRSFIDFLVAKLEAPS